MKKYFIHLLLVSFFVASVFVSSALVPTVASAQSMTISQFIELLITIGAIAPDKVTAARAVATALSQVSVATTTSITTPSSAVASSTYIQVLTPNGGESWQMDADVSYHITWGSSSQMPVNIALVPAKGAVCNLTSIPVTSSSGSNTFNILLKTARCYNSTTGASTPLVDGSYKVRVSYVNEAGVTIKDESNAVFKIIPIPVPSIKVTYPNGGESLVRNHEYVVKYTLKDVVSDNLIYLYLLDNAGNIAYNSHRVISSDHTYNLDIPSSLTIGAYKVKLKLTTNDNVVIEDTSDNFFWVSSL